MATTVGAPTPADVLTIMDALGGAFKANYATIGLDAPGEATTTLAAKLRAARTTIFGITNTDIQGLLKQSLNAAASRARYDSIFPALGLRDIIGALENHILSTIPTYYDANSNRVPWNFASNTLRPLDVFLLRANAFHAAGVPATPNSAATATATTGGSIAPTTAGTEARIKYTYIGASDWIESQPSAASTQVALVGKNNAWALTNLQGGAVVPTGVTKVRLYRQLDANAGSGDPYYYDRDVAVTAGSAFPAISMTAPDISLNQQYGPPSWLQAMMLPEEAALYLMAFGVPPQSGQQGLPVFGASAYASISNVTLNPINGFLGISNPASSGEFARWTAGTFAEGLLTTANDNTKGLQGFAGATGGIQARVTSALGAAYSLTLTYKYYDATNPTSLQTDTTGSKTFGATTVGTLLDFTIPAGRLVRQVTATNLGAGTGTFVVEAIAARSI